MTSSISNIIKRNLSLSLLKQNHNKSLSEIFIEDFIFIRLFAFRMNFTLSDYCQQRIMKTYETFKPALVITTNSWLLLVILTLMIFWPTNGLFMDVKIFEQILNIQRADLLFTQIIFFIIIKECLWLHCMNEVINYRNRYIDFLLSILPNYERKCHHKLQRYLNNYICIEYFIITWLYLIIVLLMLKKIKKLFTFLTLSIKRRYKSPYFMRKIFWNLYHREYITLYSNIAKLNESAKFSLLAVETISKSAAMIACVFYSKQVKMTMINSLLVFCMIFAFLFVNLMYYQIASLPTYNTKCIQIIFKWLARSQWSEKFVKTNNINCFSHKIQQIRGRQSMKWNFFVQTMTDNKLGFTCGHIFT
ncbi:hypothetical protein HUG17_9187 [Dermatophagoides farinae]|uniref:Uncharacterized protein n=1 Tax=Dermatophagoides farinae TaxID=6954 RepID=A0A9D4NUB4_DERFA|nr:hypothetical protein HUG17_9187 [Dermatophagoides farinae]